MSADDVASSLCEICSGLDGQLDGSVHSDAVLATLYCETCRQRLCQRCGRGHNRQRFAIDHRVVELGQVSRQPDGPLVYGESSTTCSKHHPRPLEIYCTDCEELGCVVCLSVDAHQGHRFCEVDLAAQEIRQTLSRHIEQVGTKLKEVRHAGDQHQRSVEVFEKSLRDADLQLRSEVEKLHQDIDRCVSELQCKLEEAQDTKTKMEKRCIGLQQQTNRLATFARQCQRTIDSASAIEVLRSSSEIMTEANKLVDEEIDNDLCPSRVSFCRTNLRQKLPQTDVNLVGTVSVNDAVLIQDGDENEAESFCDAVAENQHNGKFNDVDLNV